MGPLGLGLRCGTDGLGKYKTHGIDQSIRAQRSRARSAFNWRVNYYRSKAWLYFQTDVVKFRFLWKNILTLELPDRHANPIIIFDGPKTDGLERGLFSFTRYFISNINTFLHSCWNFFLWVFLDCFSFRRIVRHFVSQRLTFPIVRDMIYFSNR